MFVTLSEPQSAHFLFQHDDFQYQGLHGLVNNRIENDLYTMTALQIVTVSTHLLLQHDEFQHLDAGLHPKQLQRKMQREVNEGEAGVVRQGKGERCVKLPG